jgi:hypothetical protein
MSYVYWRGRERHGLMPTRDLSDRGARMAFPSPPLVLGWRCLNSDDVLCICFVIKVRRDQMKRASFVDKEKQVLITVAEKIGSTLGQVAALAQAAKKATRANVEPVRRRLKRTVRTKSAKTKRPVRRGTRSKTRLARRRRR